MQIVTSAPLVCIPALTQKLVSTRSGDIAVKEVRMRIQVALRPTQVLQHLMMVTTPLRKIFWTTPFPIQDSAEEQDKYFPMTSTTPNPQIPMMPTT